MAQIHIPARADEELIETVRQVADRQGWSLAKAMEIANCADSSSLMRR